jgi:hypothetical protein
MSKSSVRVFSSMRRGRDDDAVLRSMPPVQPSRSSKASPAPRPGGTAGKTALKPSLSSVGSHNRLSTELDTFARNDGGRHSLKLSRASPVSVT